MTTVTHPIGARGGWKDLGITCTGLARLGKFDPSGCVLAENCPAAQQTLPARLRRRCVVRAVHVWRRVSMPLPRRLGAVYLPVRSVLKTGIDCRHNQRLPWSSRRVHRALESRRLCPTCCGAGGQLHDGPLSVEQARVFRREADVLFVLCGNPCVVVCVPSSGGSYGVSVAVGAV